MQHNQLNEKPGDKMEQSHPYAKFILGNTLDLSKQNLTDKDVPQLSRFLLEHPHIHSVNLAYNHIGDQGLTDFVQRNLGVLQVNFTGNNISDSGLAIFTYMNHTILHANFMHNMISEKGINEFAKQNDFCFSAKFSILQLH